VSRLRKMQERLRPAQVRQQEKSPSLSAAPSPTRTAMQIF
jgi:hypothetical protein